MHRPTSRLLVVVALEVVDDGHDDDDEQHDDRDADDDAHLHVFPPHVLLRWGESVIACDRHPKENAPSGLCLHPCGMSVR